ncbi:MAG: hypothetical protein ABF539_09200 [Liquorilactobacillus nagelii]|uniref:hypothetical protein n=1 Tax=Liquorilactobacillus nagelii TaxID=82688 RepID=UPI0039E7512B
MENKQTEINGEKDKEKERKEQFERIKKLPEIKKSNYDENKVKNWRDGLLKTCVIGLAISISINIVQFLQEGFVHPELKHIFFDEKGDFQWIAVTAIITIISAVFTVIITIRRNRADLVSKSRIEWLQVNKKLTSEFITDLNFLPVLKIAKGQKWLEKRLKSLNKIIVNYNLLRLNLSNNEDNKQINECIEDCRNWADVVNSLKTGEEIPPKTALNNLIVVSRDYYKREWDKAKQGK